jgi:1-aminocyclopropane-1-carboxylate deaminase
MILDTSNITIDEINDDLFLEKKVKVFVLRLDKVHPIISGNKLFKLHYFLNEALMEKKEIITFGGAYSNHLVATAYACNLLQIKTMGIVRGEEPSQLSHTLKQCLAYKMKLKFISREEYDNATKIVDIRNNNPNAIVIPEGGFDSLGSNGAALIYDLIKDENFSHIALAVGTATTLSGLLKKAHQPIIAIPVLKGMIDIVQRIFYLTPKKNTTEELIIWNDYHFGGYAKKTTELIDFINDCWLRYKLPLDFVYTGKAFYGIVDNIKKDFFNPHSKILFIHTGGLQGNLSLPPKTLLF